MAKFHQNGGKGHGNLELVPAVETPEPLGLNVKGQYGYPCFTGEPYGAGLRFVPWASGAIRGNAQSKPLLQLAFCFQQDLDSTSATRTTGRDESQLPNHSGNDFPVKMPAGHHGNVLEAPEVHGAKDLIVPERADKRLFSLFELPNPLPTLYPVAESRSNQSHHHPSRKTHQGDLYLLQGGEGFQSYKTSSSSSLSRLNTS